MYSHYIPKPASQFPALKVTKVLHLLRKLGYREVPGLGKGSHVWLRAEGRKSICLPMHKGRELSPRLLRKMLVENAGLSDTEIDALL